MGEHADSAGAAGGQARIVALDVQPEFGARGATGIALLGASVAVLMTVIYFGATTPGRKWSADLAGILVVMLVIAAIPLALGWGFAARALAWRRRVRDERAEFERLIARGGERTEEEERFVLEHLLRRHWPTEGDVLREDCFRWAAVRAGVELPRSVVVGPVEWTSHFPRRFADEFVEPEPVRSRITARTAPFDVLSAFPQGGTTAFVILFLVVQFGVAAWRFPVNPGWLDIAGLLFAPLIILSLAATAAHERGYSLTGGPGLLAGPSRIELHTQSESRAWTADDTTVIVRRGRYGRSGLIVELQQNRGVESAAEEFRKPVTVLRFFGPDDPGFVMFWRMWNHPRRVAHLIEGVPGAAAAEKKKGEA